jgi:archaellum biogenesis protein FlaJ (TadC family)
MLSTLLTFVIVGLVAVVGLSIVLALVGAVFGLALGLAKFLLFTVAPLALIGYVAMRLFAPRRRRLTQADRDWLES